jgi:XTP/dITP diphosphohydrolase
MQKVRFATSNPHKVAEGNRVGREYEIRFEQLLVPYPEIRDENVAVVAEDGVRFVYAKVSGPVIVEDTGLFIDALKGFPGAYSAFAYRKIGCNGILKLLAGEKNRAAHFSSAIGYCDQDGVKVFEGSVAGRIADTESGSGGFGFDSVFIPEGFEKTFGEDSETKNRVSHRRIAFQKFCEWLVNK